MTGAALHIHRRGLGLTGDQLAAIVAVTGRTIRAWEAGRDPIPAGAATEIERLRERTREAITALTVDLADHDGDPTIAVYRGDDEFWAAHPDAKPLPAAWHQMVAARVAEHVPTARIVWAGATGDQPVRRWPLTRLAEAAAAARQNRDAGAVKKMLPHLRLLALDERVQAETRINVLLSAARAIDPRIGRAASPADALDVLLVAADAR
ncbi:Aca2/YdiL-like domain-containing protein [Catenuloplanes indicus]|uniref:Transcriptional regulator with XRE-family HTH domain n=1 Tax=Catenuloplanes indicus TaxID=137267 RepID=A0AAE4AUY3_9ACTN|nr:DUF1870 family protein [Catenuloplanes indicus]MDQ0363379.1 transcriptional regulator with XRE-family HTH domain [Catenuloplanes indicus]MDQ0371701.1 transcriptional regulator with XRE-family HTH domain [Catenuloplanes indicus]